MTETPQTSGADLARQALAAARAAAKTSPAPSQKKPRRTMRVHRGERGDPQGLGAVLSNLTATQGWDTGLDGGNLIDQWATIAPTELATTVQPVGYDAERGILEVRPSSPAYATQIRLFQQQLAKHLNGKLGRPAVRGIRVLAPGAGQQQPDAYTAVYADPSTTPTPEAPVKTRDTASPGYRAALDAALAHRPERQPTNPHIADAIARQEAALRANRQPETEHRDAIRERNRLTPTETPSEAARRAALAYKRQQPAGGTVPRVLDVA